MKKAQTNCLIFAGLLNCYFMNSQIDTTIWEFSSYVNGDSIYTRKLTNADKALGSGDYERAIQEFYKLVKKDAKETTYYYGLACAFSLKNSVDSAFKYLSLGTINDSTANPVTDPDFFNLITDKRWLVFEDNQQKKIINSIHPNYIDLRIVKDLWKMKIKDQALYREIEVCEKKYGVKNIKCDSLWKIKEALNEANIDDLEKIIKLYGWPKRSDFGGIGAGTAFLVIQHSDLSLQKKYLPMITEAAKQNEASWEEVALITDRILTSENKPQKYGSQIKYNDATKQFELYPLEDPTEVDKRRRSIGLDSLKNYVSYWGIIFNIPQKK